MKITADHLAHMTTAIERLNTESNRAMYREGKFNGADKVKDLNKRFRWDLMAAAGINRWMCDNLYSYLNDTHIDTALRSIVKPL